ncbi:ABC transporter permease [Serinicoccus marinus]|uniref:ABC transporter permease n=1 Tax=Serinicoccus marinus TaxID=247333 RepID=UPI0003B5E603|nr:ABC transporter permease [Serinicoccus marinus]
MSTTTAPWILVAAREIRVKLTDKNFLIGTGLTLVLLLAAMFVPALIGGGSASYDVAVTDDAASGVVAQAEQSLQATDEEAEITLVEVADRAAAETTVQEGDADAALVGEPGAWELLHEGGAPTQLDGALTEAVRTTALATNAEAAGTSVADLTSGSELAQVDLAEEDEGAMSGPLAYILGFAFAMLFYFAALMFGMQIANSVVEEKQSRIIEILAAKIPTRQLLMGKVLGNTVLAFGQLALITAVSLVGLTFVDLDVALPGLTQAILWYLPFFLVGFLALACVWAAAGALASRTEDLQQTTMPLTMVLVVLFIVGINLDGRWQQIFSFVPVASTFVMPVRIIEGDTALWEPALALLLALAFCGVTIALGARLYERALLHTSGSLSWRKAMSLQD